MKHLFQQYKQFATALLLVLVVGIGAGCGTGGQLPVATELTVWRYTGEGNDIRDAISNYRVLYPHVSIDVEVFDDYDEYETALFDAWARQEGPDIFSVPNWRLGRFRNFIEPMPEGTLTFGTTEQRKRLGKTETVPTSRQETMYAPITIETLFANVVYEDVVYDDQIYGLPLEMDTLALYYNRQKLDTVGVSVAPQTWDEFSTTIPQIARYTRSTDSVEPVITQPAAALGEVDNVPYFFDILSLMMMQGGATISSDNDVDFTGSSSNTGRSAGTQALSFYTSFSNSAASTYTWNEEQPGALELFTQGNLAYYFGYYSDLAEIQDRSPNLRVGYTGFPQTNPESPISYANYPIETVYSGSERPEHAWNFLRFMTTAQQAQLYTDETGTISPLRVILNQQQLDPELSVFANQALTARGWYHGYNPDVAESAFASMINEQNKGLVRINDLIDIAESTVRETLRNPN